MPAVLEYGVPPPGYRLPDDTRVGRATLQVSDLQRSVEYYSSVVGLRVVRELRGGVALGPADEDVTLIVLRERRGARPVPRRGRLGLFHVALLVPDRPALARVLRHLLKIGVQPGMSDHFVSEALYLWDPDGLGLEIYADRPRAIWRADHRQIYMTTEPLDVRGLLASVPDDGAHVLPRGSVVGHMHLSVDRIETASAFFHQGLGFDRMVWTYPGALFMSAGGYHHHLGTNTWSAGAPLATDDDARLVEWDVVLPAAADVADAAKSLEAAGYAATVTGDMGRVIDPWGVGLVLRTSPA